MVYGKGYEPPDWMEDLGSIFETAQHYEERVPMVLEQTGGIVLCSVVNGVAVEVSDRSTGQCFYRCHEEQIVGAVIRRDWEAATSGHPKHKWGMHLKLLRRVSIDEVKTLAERCQHKTKVCPGKWWYEVQVD